jgi:hypothetical protein
MSMDIVQSGPVAGRPVETAGRLPSRALIRKINTQSSEANTEGRATIVEIHPELGRFASANERLNALAATARTADKKAAVVDEAISRMKHSLESITKNYPPFPPGSEDRVRTLKSYAALRRQIAELTIPPEQDPTAPKQKSEFPGSGNYTFVLEANGQVRMLPREKLHVGPSGLIIPEVQEQASDEEIQQAVGTLDATARALAEQRAQATAEVQAGAAAELEERKKRVLTLVVPGGSADLGLPEPAAQQISQKVRDDLGSMSEGLLHIPELQFAIAGA